MICLPKFKITMQPKLFLLAILLTSIGCDKGDDSTLDYNHVIAENTNTHKITIHPNKRVAFLKMSSDEYKSYVENDEFRKDNGRYRESIIKDIYKKFKMIMIT